MNITHQQKKMDLEALKAFRDRFEIPVPRRRHRRSCRSIGRPKTASRCSTCKRAPRRAGRLPAGAPAQGGAARGAAAVGFRQRCSSAPASREMSTTMAFVRMLSHSAARQEHRQARRADRPRRVAHLRHGRHVPPDRHLFAGRPALQAGGCRPADVLPRGQERARSCEEGINEAGAMSSWIAAATSYSTHGMPMIPFYIYYSMFGFQRVGDSDLGGRRHARARLPARRRPPAARR